MKWHSETMIPEQQALLKTLGPLMQQRGFYLAGGTAAALYLGHRQSIDLDWFCCQPLSEPIQLAQAIQEDALSLVSVQIAPGTLHGIISGVRISWFEYIYPLLEPLANCLDYGCSLASLSDLASMKLAAIAQRGARKDFIDLYALGTRYASLSDMLEGYQKKYKGVDIASVLYGLAYFKDADKEPMPRMLWDTEWGKMKHTIQDWVKAFFES